MAIVARQSVEAPVVAHSMRELTSLMRDYRKVEVQWRLRVYHGSRNLDRLLRFEDGAHVTTMLNEGYIDGTVHFGTKREGPTAWISVPFKAPGWLYTAEIEKGTVLIRSTAVKDDAVYAKETADGLLAWEDDEGRPYTADRYRSLPKYGLLIQMWNTDRVRIVRAEPINHDILEELRSSLR